MIKLHPWCLLLSLQVLIISTSRTNPAISQPIVKVWSWEDSLAVKQLVEHYLDQLVVIEEGYLIVHFVSNLPDKMQGMTFQMNTPDSSSYPVLKVVVNARLNLKQRQLVLAHEMVHVKQMLRGELRVSEGKVKWKGRNYRYQWGAESYRAPWESEAHRIDNWLARRGTESEGEPLIAIHPYR